MATDDLRIVHIRIEELDVQKVRENNNGFNLLSEIRLECSDICDFSERSWLLVIRDFNAVPFSHEVLLKGVRER